MKRLTMTLRSVHGNDFGPADKSSSNAPGHPDRDRSSTATGTEKCWGSRACAGGHVVPWLKGLPFPALALATMNQRVQGELNRRTPYILCLFKNKKTLLEATLSTKDAGCGPHAGKGLQVVRHFLIKPDLACFFLSSSCLKTFNEPCVRPIDWLWSRPFMLFYDGRWLIHVNPIPQSNKWQIPKSASKSTLCIDSHILQY